MNYFFKQTKSQKGYVLILVMILMLVGSLILTSLLKFTGTGISTTTMYVDKGKELYAADAGIEDGRWRIKNDDLPTGYDVYDYYELSGHSWSYDLQTDTGVTPNGYNTDVTLKNMWIPTLPIPTSSQAQITLQGTTGSPPKLIVTGSTRDLPTATNPGVYQIKVSYFGGSALGISSVGVWLPPGFTYHAANSNNLDNTLHTPTENMYSSENWTAAYKSGQSIIWNFSPVYPFLGDTGNNQLQFPGVDLSESPDLVSTITFEFDGPEGQGPAAVSWIDTDTTFSGGLTYCWDGDQKVFQILSTAGDTSVEAYTIKSELRMMAAAIQGDYFATGNTLMYDSNNDSYHIRDTWTSADHASSNTIDAESPVGAGNGIPSDADVSKAFLYWTSWFDSSNIVSVYSDSCANYNNWVRSGLNPYLDTGWGGTGQFSGHIQTAGPDSFRELTLKDNVVNLDNYKTGRVEISWEQNAMVTATIPEFEDSCTNFNNWVITTPNAWEYYPTSGFGNKYFRGNYNSGETTYISTNNDIDISTYSSNEVSLSWSHWMSITAVPTTIWSDDFRTDSWARSPSSYWTYDSIGQRYRGRTSGSTLSNQILSMSSNVDLSPCTSGTVTIFWDQNTSGSNFDNNDRLYVSFSSNGGTSYGSEYLVFSRNSILTQITLDNSYLVNNFRMRFRVEGFSDGSGSNRQYINIDNVRISYLPPATGPGIDDGVDVYFSNNSGGTWSPAYEVFRGSITTSQPPDSNFSITIPDDCLTEHFRLRISLVGFDVAGQYCNIDNIRVTGPASIPLDLSDGLDFAFYGGGEWSADYPAFRGDPLESSFSYVIPKDYLNNFFKLRLKLVGFDGTGQYCNITNIRIRAMMPDSSAYFKINSNQVYFNGSNPALGSQDIIADKTQVIPGVQGFSYSSFKDVTDLVKWELNRENPTATHYPGIAQYTVGNVNGTKGDNDPNRTQLAHAGWSLIIVYSSPATLGHQLYLYDQFSHAYDAGDVDFDGDEHYGGTVSGFIVPEPIDDDGNGVPDETNVAKMTIMVGEGDEFIAGDTIGGHYYPGDFVAFNADEDYWDDTPHYYDIPNSNKLWDKITTNSNTQAAPNNVWNGKSTVFTADGVDVDTFYVPWGNPVSNGLLKPGDTSAHIDLCTGQDNWNLVYIILSFRSKATTGGSVSYLIR